MYDCGADSRISPIGIDFAQKYLTLSAKSKPSMQIREIDLSANSFTGISGAKYIIHDTLPVARFEVFEALQVEALNNTSIAGFTGEVKDVWQDLQQVKVADATVKLYNILNGLERVKNQRSNPILRMCTLFICQENEPIQWSEAMSTEKLADWGDISQGFFLGCGVRFLRNYISAFDTNSLFGSPVNPTPSEADEPQSENNP
jgi:hypothetical protein